MIFFSTRAVWKVYEWLLIPNHEKDYADTYYWSRRITCKNDLFNLILFVVDNYFKSKQQFFFVRSKAQFSHFMDWLSHLYSLRSCNLNFVFSKLKEWRRLFLLYIINWKTSLWIVIGVNSVYGEHDFFIRDSWNGKISFMTSPRDSPVTSGSTMELDVSFRERSCCDWFSSQPLGCLVTQRTLSFPLSLFWLGEKS